MSGYGYNFGNFQNNFVPIIHYTNKIISADKAALDFFETNNFDLLKNRKLEDLTPYIQEDGQHSYIKIDFCFSQAIKNGRASVHLQLLSMRGNAKYADMEIISTPELFVIIIKDITVYKQTENELRSRIMRLERAVETGSDLVWRLDLQTTMLFCYPSIYKLLGYESNLSSITINTLRKFCDEADFYKLISSIENITDSQEEITNEFKLIKSDGKIEWYRMRGSVEKKLEDGQPWVISGTMTKISTIKANEMKLRQLNERLIEKEEQLRKSELNYKKIYNRAGYAILIIDANGCLITVNNLAPSILGYKTKSELQKLTINDLSSNKNVFDKNRVMERVADGGKNIFEWLFVKRDGTEFWCEVALQNIIIEGKKNILAFMKDIDRSKRAEIAYRTISERHRMALDASNDGIWEYDTKSNSLYWSSLCFKMFGITPNQGEPIEIWDSMSKNDSSFISADRFISRVLLKGTATSGYSFIDAHGQKKHIIVKGKKVLSEADGEQHLKVVGTFSDITELKEKELELARQNSIFSTLLDNIPVGIYMVSSNNDVLTINNKLALFIGETVEQIKNNKSKVKLKNAFKFNTNIPYPIDEMPIVHALDGKFKEINDLDIVRPDGSRITVYMVGAPVIGNDGQVWAGLVGVTDITKSKNYERELKVQRDKIENQNREYIALNEELVETNKHLVLATERAEQSDRLKSSFLANLSHEIRTPMNGILGFIDLLKEKDLESDEKDFYIDIIRRSCQQLMGIITDIVEISKIDTGQITANISKTNIYEMVHDIASIFKLQSAEKPQIEVFYDIDHDCKNLLVETDEVKLKQIFTNLANNALKYTDKGFIKISLQKLGGKVAFAVEDTGIGIRQENLGIIFNRFVRIESNKDSVTRGAGLGLAIAAAYVRLLRGQIDVKSEYGKGSLFTVRIPINFATEEN